MKLALWQTPYFGEKALMLRALEQQASVAKGQGADLLICPEMITSGYNIGPEAVRNAAETSEGPSAKRIKDIAQRWGISIVFGYPETNTETDNDTSAETQSSGRKPFNACQFINADGKCLSSHRKTRLFGELDAQQFSSANTIAPPFEWQGIQVGLLICYEVEFEASIAMLANQGATLILVPTANMVEFDDVQDKMIPEFSRQLNVSIVYGNACGREGPLIYGGKSLVCQKGKTLAKADRESTLLIVNLTI
jgi:5-aminopentanamidase